MVSPTRRVAIASPIRVASFDDLRGLPGIPADADIVGIDVVDGRPFVLVAGDEAVAQ